MGGGAEGLGGRRVFGIIERNGYAVVAEPSLQAREREQFSIGYPSEWLNSFHEQSLNKRHSFFNG